MNTRDNNNQSSQVDLGRRTFIKTSAGAAASGLLSSFLKSVAQVVGSQAFSNPGTSELLVQFVEHGLGLCAKLMSGNLNDFVFKSDGSAIDRAHFDATICGCAHNILDSGIKKLPSKDQLKELGKLIGEIPDADSILKTPTLRRALYEKYSMLKSDPTREKEFATNIFNSLTEQLEGLESLGKLAQQLQRAEYELPNALGTKILRAFDSGDLTELYQLKDLMHAVTEWSQLNTDRVCGGLTQEKNERFQALRKQLKENYTEDTTRLDKNDRQLAQITERAWQAEGVFDGVAIPREELLNERERLNRWRAG